MRKMTDFQITSHIPFVVVFFLSIYMNFYEMTLLVGLVVVFSVLYHIGEEERNVFSYIDNVTSCSLSMYGNIQLFYSPSSFILYQPFPRHYFIVFFCFRISKRL